MAIKLGGGGGSASQIDEVVFLNNAASVVTLDDERVYLKGGVYETTLSTYPDATPTYIHDGTVIDLSGAFTTEEGVVWDGSYFWVVGAMSNMHDRVAKYDASGTYQNVLFYLGGSAERGTSRDVTWDGTYFWVIFTNGTVNKYNASGTYQATFSTASQTSDASGITWDGSHLWVVDRGSDYVYKYNSSGVYQNVSFDADPLYYPRGIVADGSDFWVVDDGYNKAIKYNSSGVMQQAFRLTDNIITGIAKVGSNLWISSTTYGLRKYVPALGIETYTATTNNGQQAEGNNYVRVK